MLTDWVYKELDLALEQRDPPARLQIVCVNGESFEPAMAANLFPPGRVRDHFSSPLNQMINYCSDDDNEALSNDWHLFDEPAESIRYSHPLSQLASGLPLASWFSAAVSNDRQQDRSGFPG